MRVVVGVGWCSDFDVVVAVEEEGERWVPRDDDNSKVVAGEEEGERCVPRDDDDSKMVAVVVGGNKWRFFF